MSESRAPSPHTFGKKLTLPLIKGFFCARWYAFATANPDVLVRSYVLLSRLLVRARTLAYHGGIGTVSQVFAAGIQQLITACAHDQFGNAVRVESLGCGAQVERENLLSRSVAIGERFKQRARSWKQKFPVVGDKRFRRNVRHKVRSKPGHARTSRYRDQSDCNIAMGTESPR